MPGYLSQSNIQQLNTAMPAKEGKSLLIEKAVKKVLHDPANRTPDLGGKLSTGQMCDLVIEQL